MEFTPKWSALAREAAIASQSLSAGLSALRKANVMQPGIYNYAFFNLSIGMERITKLIFLLDWVVETNGSFPLDEKLKSFSHNIQRLFDYAMAIAAKRKLELGAHADLYMPITGPIIKCLSDFGRSSRYYNLDYLSGQSVSEEAEPIRAWFDGIANLVFEKHYPEAKQKVDRDLAQGFQAAAGHSTWVHFNAEDGTMIDNVGEMVLHNRKTTVLQKYGTFYAATVVRCLCTVLVKLEPLAQSKALEDIPDLHEFFVALRGDDHFLKTRRTFRV